MDILFTFPQKNPKYMNIKQLQKSYQAMDLSYKNKNKQEMVNFLFLTYTSTNKRIQIKFHNEGSKIRFQQVYYVKSLFRCRSILKIYDNNNKEIYRFDTIVVSYNKIHKEWDSVWEKKEDKHELFRLRNIYLYLEFKHVFMNFYLQKHLVKDIFTYMMKLYKNYTYLPSKLYKIL